MFRIRSLSSLAYVLAGTVVLSACGGGGSHGTLPATPSQALTPGTPVGSAPATFTFTFPKNTPSSHGRKPQYLSSATASITLVVTDTKNAGDNSDIYANVPAALKVVQYFNPANLTDGVSPGHCGTDPGNAGNYKCIATFLMPIGKDTTTITSWDQSESSCTKNASPAPPTCSVGHVLSSQTGTFTTVQATANSFAVSLDANVNAFVLSTTSGFCAGSFTVAANQNVPTVGTSTLTFNASSTDPASKTIVAPGLPTLAVNGHTDANPGNGNNGYTDAGTGGTVTVKVNQSSQTFTVQPSSSALTSATIAVTMTPPSAGDGLSYNKSLTFTVSSGAAPSSGLLAAVEQTNTTPGNAAGQVDLFLMSNPSDPTGFSSTPVTPSTITPAGSPSKDVDNPQDMVFDTNGDLLIANGGAGNPDFGNFACIPAGVITSTTPSASSVTIVTSHADDPISIALSSDASVGIANLPAAAPFHLVEEVLSGTYAEASSTREISNTDVSGEGALNVTAVATNATNPAGTFAVGLSNGANPPLGNTCNPNTGSNPAGNASEVFIRRPNGSSTVINDSNVTIVEPLVAYDAADSRLVVLSTGACNAASSVTGSTAYLSTWNIDSSTTATNTSSQFLFSAGGSPASSQFTYSHCCIAASSSGYVAISGTLTDLNSGVTGPIVQVFNPGTGTRTTQGAPIPFNGTTSSNGTTFEYCVSVCFVNSLKFLSPTKLLIGFQSDNSTYQGFYLYNVATTSAPVAPCSPTCYDANGSAYGNGPTFLDFKHTTNHPLAAAYHP
jgi:hypothetical protein